MECFEDADVLTLLPAGGAPMDGPNTKASRSRRTVKLNVRLCRFGPPLFPCASSFLFSLPDVPVSKEGRCLNSWNVPFALWSASAVSKRYRAFAKRKGLFSLADQVLNYSTDELQTSLNVPPLFTITSCLPRSVEPKRRRK
ncbi:hypothetical protein AOLI_G00166360 [Acnodon oligacanthus]